MKKYLFIVLLVGVCFGQDVYPYFSDMEKQLEFEKRKIVIEEGESTQQIISGGGSVFNWFSLINDNAPMYRNAPISTEYKYFSYFNIVVNNKSLNEIEMLSLMGLNDEVNRIMSAYKKEMESYEKEMKSIEEEMRLYNNSIKNDGNNELGVTLLFGGVVSVAYGILNKKLHFITIGIVISSNGIAFSLPNLKKPKKPSTHANVPMIRQQLNVNQTKSMVESYNRKLYSEIANK